MGRMTELGSGFKGRFLVGEGEENHLLSYLLILLPAPILLRVLTCGRKLLGLWPATQENPSARWSAPNFHQPDSVILQVRPQLQLPPTHCSRLLKSQLQVFRLEVWSWAVRESAGMLGIGC